MKFHKYKLHDIKFNTNYTNYSLVFKLEANDVIVFSYSNGTYHVYNYDFVDNLDDTSKKIINDMLKYNDFGSYIKYINESLISKDESNPFYIDEELVRILNLISEESDTNSKIADAFLVLNYRMISTKVSFIKLSSKKEYLECLKSKDITDKNDDYSDSSFIDKYKSKFFEIKVGRLARQVIDLYNHIVSKIDKNKRIKVTESDIELFVNSFKSKFDYIKRNVKENIKIVQGKEISSYYDGKKYAKNYGQLAYSCMRYDECQDFFDIYESNDTVSLAVMLDPNDKLLGRALLFKLVDGNTFMDRVYTSDDSDYLVFIEWAKENKFLYKEKNNSNSSTKIMTPSDNYKTGISMNLEVKVNKYNIKYKRMYRFPYLDTLKYLYWQEGVLSNIKSDKHGVYVFLEDADGNAICNNCQGTGLVDCPECETFDGCGNCDEGNIDCPTCGGFTYDY